MNTKRRFNSAVLVSKYNHKTKKKKILHPTLISPSQTDAIASPHAVKTSFTTEG